MAVIKLIATDLDGTFLKGGHTPHPENIKAVRACQEAGIRVCACTGRNWAECRKIVEEVGFDDFCAVNNGAAIVEVKTGELRYRNRFDPEALAGLVDVMLSSPNVKFGLTGLESTGVLRGHMEDWFESEPKELLDELYHLTEYDTKEELVEACKEDVERINCHLPFLEHFEQVRDAMRNYTDLEIMQSTDGYLEIGAKDGTKAEALTVLTDIYNVKPENVMALGDNYNDLYMLAWAGTGVAMGNADQRLKDLADYVTDTNVNAGVAKAIYEIALQRA